MSITDKKYCILIVDDEKSNTIALSDILSPDYKVLALRDSTETVRVAQENKPDILLLDILMPDMDGFEVITALKKNSDTQNIPVIFITGLEDTEAEKRGLELGAADYITKPFNSAVVGLRIRNQIKILQRDSIEHDLNVVLKLKEDLIAAKEYAENSNRVKSEFLSRMSHEMLTPLNSIAGMVQIAEMYPDMQKKSLMDIESSARELLNLINNVLDMSEMEYGTSKLNESEFTFVSMLHSAFDEATRHANKKEQKLNSRIDPAIPDELLGDAKKLYKVIVNLLANAIKFSPEHSEIDFYAGMQEEDNKTVTLEFYVEDHGIGMSQEQQDNLFTIFEQGDGSLKRKHGGIGIGLALSKRIVEMMHGSLWVESQPGKGSKFSFTCKLNKTNHP